ncbi:MAG: acetyl-CoA C-acyltransferase, partial [Leptolyngbya sp. Prado105]|nr:acetyl-CoA C-acyltransferase [Leptolyngbya sp. Prado105]
MQAIADAFRAISAGEGDVYIAGGVESMSRAPFVMGKSETPFARNMEVFDTTMGWRFINTAFSAQHHPFTMGETAENVAAKYNISREAQDAFALQSQERWAAAQAADKFANEIIPIPIFQKGKQVDTFSMDEHPRATSMEALGKLKPAFKTDGSVTAGNSSGINDGAAACLIVSEAFVNKHNLKPMARIVGAAVAGLDPAIMGVGPIPAVEKLLSRT